jgi:hypothetical protein
VIRLSLLFVSLSVAIGLLVIETNGAFFDSTSSAGELQAGTVEISDSARATGPLFIVSGMGGGDSETRCVNLTYTGSIFPAEVKMYGSDQNENAGGLGEHLDMTVDLVTIKGNPPYSQNACLTSQRQKRLYPVGSGGSRSNTGTLKDFCTNHRELGTALPVWEPQANSPAQTSRVVRITLKLGSSQLAQGKTANPEFVWQVNHR